MKKGMTLPSGAFTGEKERFFQKNVEFYIEMQRKSDYNIRLYVKMSKTLS